MKSKAVLLLAHGAGAPMDSPFMNVISEGLAEKGIQVVRFEFPYMQAIRASGKRRPPDRMDTLLVSLKAAIEEVAHEQPLFIGGKSMGGRVASIVACEQVPVQGLVCLGYPFHPRGNPEKLRTNHLNNVRCPSLIVQGTRDPFGMREEVEQYSLSNQIDIHWIEQADHDLTIAKRAGAPHGAGFTLAVEAIAAFILSRHRPHQQTATQNNELSRSVLR